MSSGANSAAKDATVKTLSGLEVDAIAIGLTSYSSIKFREGTRVPGWDDLKKAKVWTLDKYARVRSLLAVPVEGDKEVKAGDAPSDNLTSINVFGAARTVRIDTDGNEFGAAPCNVMLIQIPHGAETAKCLPRETLDNIVRHSTPIVLFGPGAKEIAWELAGSKQPLEGWVVDSIDHFTDIDGFLYTVQQRKELLKTNTFLKYTWAIITPTGVKDRSCPYMVVKGPWRYSAFRYVYNLLAPLIVWPRSSTAGVRNPWLSIALTNRTTLDRDTIVSQVLCNLQQWQIRVLDTSGEKMATIQTRMHAQVARTESVAMPLVHGELGLLHSGTPLTEATVRALERKMDTESKEEDKRRKKEERVLDKIKEKDANKQLAQIAITGGAEAAVLMVQERRRTEPTIMERMLNEGSIHPSDRQQTGAALASSGSPSSKGPAVTPVPATTPEARNPAAATENSNAEEPLAKRQKKSPTSRRNVGLAQPPQNMASAAMNDAMTTASAPPPPGARRTRRQQPPRGQQL